MGSITQPIGIFRSDDGLDEADKPWYPVEITKVDNGFVINIACKELVAKTWGEVCKGLAEYWADPKKAEKKYCK